MRRTPLLLTPQRRPCRANFELSQISDTLTNIGLEVEHIENKANELKNFTVAKVLTAEKHPDADRLMVCHVNTGSGQDHVIVCGADNVRVGLYVVLAPVGAVLPGNITIKSSDLKGVTSEGMLCSARQKFRNVYHKKRPSFKKTCHDACDKTVLSVNALAQLCKTGLRISAGFFGSRIMKEAVFL